MLHTSMHGRAPKLDRVVVRMADLDDPDGGLFCIAEYCSYNDNSCNEIKNGNVDDDNDDAALLATFVDCDDNLESPDEDGDDTIRESTQQSASSTSGPGSGQHDVQTPGQKRGTATFLNEATPNSATPKRPLHESAIAGRIKTRRVEAQTQVPGSFEVRDRQTASDEVVSLPVREASITGRNNTTCEAPLKRVRVVTKQNPKSETLNQCTITSTTDFDSLTVTSFKNWIKREDKTEEELAFIRDMYIQGRCLGYRLVASEGYAQSKAKRKEVKVKHRARYLREFNEKPWGDRQSKMRKLIEGNETITKRERYSIMLYFELDLPRNERHMPKGKFFAERKGSIMDKDEDGEPKRKKFMNARFAMLTYFHDTWKLQKPKWGELDDIERFETLCKEDPYVKQLWAKLSEQREQIKKRATRPKERLQH